MAPNNKRTYSSRDKKQTAFAQESQRKRSKVNQDDDDDYLRQPGDPPRGRPETSSSSLKKAKFSGPVSFTSDDASSPAPKRKSPSMFDKALANYGKLKPVKSKQFNIHGSREEFQNTMSDPTRTKKTNGGATSRYLPTPPSDADSQRSNNFSTIFPGLGGRGHSVVSGRGLGVQTRPSMMSALEPKTSKTAEKTTKYEEPQGPYIPRQYEADKSLAPRRDVCGNDLSSKSEQAKLWSINQLESPFLRLPAEIRNRIYDFAFGDKTIKISYETYRMKSHKNKPDKVTPVFKYHCTVFNRHINPFRDDVPQAYLHSANGFTLLNNICRQLYLETAYLPFTTSLIAFDSHNIMVNFVLHEQYLSRRQRCAITKLALPDHLPGRNMLGYLPNVEQVYLAYEEYKRPKGWYRVVREKGKKIKLLDRYDEEVKDV